MMEEGARWVEMLPVARLDDRAIVCARVGHVDLLLIRDGDRVFACERTCPHEQADPSLGRIADRRLRCPRHLASFDLVSGDISAGWPSRPLRLYPAEIKDGWIRVDAAALEDGAPGGLCRK
jgi:3-phenylpropionate/trans-cinnamate dioxygenase ferredoxin component